MSRYYNMAVRIGGFDQQRTDRIKDAVCDEWEFDNWNFHAGNLTASADGKLCGGETEEAFAERLAKAVWAANGGYCEVEVNATYLEELPCETHCLDEDDYARLLSATDKPTEMQEGRSNG
jgi:hypothetical protein